VRRRSPAIRAVRSGTASATASNRSARLNSIRRHYRPHPGRSSPATTR